MVMSVGLRWTVRDSSVRTQVAMVLHGSPPSISLGGERVAASSGRPTAETKPQTTARDFDVACEAGLLVASGGSFVMRDPTFSDFNLSPWCLALGFNKRQSERFGRGVSFCLPHVHRGKYLYGSGKAR